METIEETANGLAAAASSFAPVFRRQYTPSKPSRGNDLGRIAGRDRDYWSPRFTQLNVRDGSQPIPLAGDPRAQTVLSVFLCPSDPGEDRNISYPDPEGGFYPKSNYPGVSRAFGSAHPGGAFFLLADGAVRFANETIDPVTYGRLAHRADGQTIGEW